MFQTPRSARVAGTVPPPFRHWSTSASIRPCIGLDLRCPLAWSDGVATALLDDGRPGATEPIAACPCTSKRSEVSHVPRGVRMRCGQVRDHLATLVGARHVVVRRGRVVASRARAFRCGGCGPLDTVRRVACPARAHRDPLARCALFGRPPRPGNNRAFRGTNTARGAPTQTRWTDARCLGRQRRGTVEGPRPRRSAPLGRRANRSPAQPNATLAPAEAARPMGNRVNRPSADASGAHSQCPDRGR